IARDSANRLASDLNYRLLHIFSKFTASINDTEREKDLSNKSPQPMCMLLELVTVLKQRKFILNVGGKKYTTSIETLTRETDTFFTALFSGRWQLAVDPNDNSIFIDRNGQVFTHILEWLRTSIV
ncbi:unnamed protein product, partial [Rotaria magnacalcarata]